MTFTFSRALHNMRYGGAIVSPIDTTDWEVHFKVIDGKLYHRYPHLGQEWFVASALTGAIIMGSWREVL